MTSNVSYVTQVCVLALALAGLLATPAAAKTATTEPSAEAQAIIANLGLREAPKPIPRPKGWKPQKVVAMLIPAVGLDTPEFEAALRAAAGETELVIDRSGGLAPSPEAMAGADAFLGLCSPIMLQRASDQLRWVHSYFVGMDRCKPTNPKQAANTTFSNNKRLSGPAIAEHAIAMLLSLSRNLPSYQAAQLEKRWDRAPSANVRFGELQGKTMLIAGLGGIGTQIAQRAHGLGMRVIATRNSSKTGPSYVEYVGLADELSTLSARADVVVNALPLTSSTTGLFDKDAFAAIKKGAIYLSVGRGKTTVTDDLVAALQSNHLYGAGLDVTDPEPLPRTHPLWTMPNVLITPHIAASGVENAERTMIIAAENLRRYIAGLPLLNVVNVRKGY